MKQFYLSIFYNALKGTILFYWGPQGTPRERNSSIGTLFIRSLLFIAALWSLQNQAAFTQFSCSCQGYLDVNAATLDLTNKFTINQAIGAISRETVGT